MLGVDLLTASILIGAGAVGWLVLSHGWGWVLAKVEGFIAKEKAAVASNLTSNLATRVASLEQSVAVIRAKVGA